MKSFFQRDFGLSVGIATFLIAGWGVLTIYSAQSESAAPLLLAGKQTLFLLFAFAAMYAAGKVDFSFYRESWLYWTAAAYFLLLLLPFCGVRVNGMRGWFALGPLYLQPSEVMKGVYLLALVMTLDLFRTEARRFMGSLALTFFWTLPILFQPDFGTAFVYWCIWATVYFFAGGRILYLCAAGAAAATAAGLFVLRNPYALRRITGFLSPEGDPLGSGWHVMQFQLAVSRGGWSGAKLGNALWSNSYLPFSYNDSAFATLGETLGVSGMAILLALFAVLLGMLLWRAGTMAAACRVERLIVAGAGAAIAVQMILHAMVNTALLPPTGITMPLVSYGGSSLLGTCLLLALAVSAARAGVEAPPREEGQSSIREKLF